MSRPIIVVVIVIAGCAVDMHEASPQFLLIVRERLRPGSEEAYDTNELKLATACATLKCPHPYLALVPIGRSKEVWWLNAFASREERDGLDAAYERNEPLMAEMKPLGRRKEDFREALTTTMTAYRGDLSSGAVLRIAGARFLVINTAYVEGAATGAVFEGAAGERFVIASASDRAVAEDLAARSGTGAMILAVQPQWSFPAEAWIDADPAFWRSSPAARNRGQEIP